VAQQRVPRRRATASVCISSGPTCLPRQSRSGSYAGQLSACRETNAHLPWSHHHPGCTTSRRRTC
jgi:hypothetical protein